MCGRFVRAREAEAYTPLLGVEGIPEISASYNVAPSQPVLVGRRQEGRPEAALLRWGLVPFWSKDGKAFINARAETLASKPSFKAAFRHRRCLIPADGYFEWKTEGKHKQPYHFRMKAAQPFVFAGLWDTWQDVEGCAIITTEANDLQKPIHDRMPVLLSREASEVWMDPDVRSDALLLLLVPFPSERMQCHPVSPFVNNPRNNSPGCIEPV